VILFLIAVTILSFFLSLGKNTPIYPWLYQHIPTFDMFVGPARWLLWAELALSLLAGYGVQTWRRPQSKALYWTRLGTAGAFAAIAGALLAMQFSTRVNQAQASAVIQAGLLAAGSGLLSLTAPYQEPDRRHRWSWAVILLVCVDLLFTFYPLNPVMSVDLYRVPWPGSAEIQQRLNGGRLFLNADDEYDIKFKRFFLFDTFDPGEDWLNLREVYLPNANMLDGLPSANNFDPLVPARYSRWMKYLSSASPTSQKNLIARMGVSLIERVDWSQKAGISFTETSRLDRVRWVPCAELANTPEEAWNLVTSQENTLEYARSTVILEDIQASQQTACNPTYSGQTQIYEDTPNQLIADVNSPSEGWLVIEDTWYPGWKAWVDGQSTKIYHGDYLFRAVYVSAGQHQVVMKYQPVSLYFGLLVSLFGWAGFWLANRTRRSTIRLPI
jgi:hypothetical protein